MARQQQIVITDDYSGKKLPKGTKPTQLSLNGKSYRLDLSAQSVKALEKALAPFIDGAERVTKSKARGAKTKSASGSGRPDHLPTVRQWARDNGYEVSDRGRIPAEIRSAYEAAK